MSALKERTLLPGSDQQASDQYADLLAVVAEDHAVSITAGERSAVLPEPLRHVLADVLEHLSRGTAVIVEPHRTLLTTQEAADILGITRPTFVRLLEDGEIPFTAPRRHRRVELTDILAYQRDLQERRTSALSELGTTESGSTGAGFVSTR
ncbi:helix-turn-helix domain-containing protein [Williamsia sp.]|uniref:helix-turn-helix domain-containing protein n=1 Tax=Williamsia sp. TaxID=1872085 RepID=UPI002F93EA64